MFLTDQLQLDQFVCIHTCVPAICNLYIRYVLLCACICIYVFLSDVLYLLAGDKSLVCAC